MGYTGTRTTYRFPNLVHADFRCPSLPAPPTAPQQGWSLLTDPGEIFGPCLGRDLYGTDAVAFAGCAKVRAGVVKDQSADSADSMQFTAKIWFDPAEMTVAHLTLELVFSHDVDASTASVRRLVHVVAGHHHLIIHHRPPSLFCSQMSVATSITQGVRANHLLVEIDVGAAAALADGIDVLTATHVADGESEICLHDAVCIEDPGEKSKCEAFFSISLEIDLIYSFSSPGRQADGHEGGQLRPHHPPALRVRLRGQVRLRQADCIRKRRCRFFFCCFFACYLRNHGETIFFLPSWHPAGRAGVYLPGRFGTDWGQLEQGRHHPA